jgi:hypothetical protein
MQLVGDLEMLHFVRINWLNWIGNIDRMYSKRKVKVKFRGGALQHYSLRLIAL